VNLHTNFTSDEVAPPAHRAGTLRWAGLRHHRFNLSNLTVTVCTTLGVIALSAWLQAPTQDEWPQLVAVNVTVGALFVFSAGLLAHDPAHGMTARLLRLAAACWLFNWARVPLPGPLPFILSRLGTLFWLFATWALLRYPNAKLQTPFDRLYVAFSAAWLSLGHGTLSLLYDPHWFPQRWPLSPWWPTIAHDHAVYDSLHIGVLAIDGLLGLLYVSLAIHRMRRFAGLDRWMLAPLAVSLIGGGLVVGLRTLTPLMADALSWQRLADALNSTAVLIVPITMIAVIVRTELSKTVVADMIVQLSGRLQTDPAYSVTDQLRVSLRDQTARILFPPDEEGVVVDEAGRSAPAPSSDRLVIPIDGGTGHPLGLIDAHPSLRRHPELVEAVAGAVGLALRNARLHATVRSQLEQVHASRKRILEAGITERRKLERDLHDGVQQRLLALTLTLARVRTRSSDPVLLQVVESTRQELHAALDELRDLAHGVMPSLLVQGGLMPALDEVIGGIPMTITLKASSQRCSPAVETTAYFIVCEALANVVKHAKADCASVTANVIEGQLILEVDDDGQGGAEITRGTGIAGLVDRARAIGGELTIENTPVGGTLLRAVLPCA
jgi:signal transduction histidine kinase